MRRATAVSITTSASFYASVSVLGYMAFGNAVHTDILTQPSLGPVWAIVMANVLVYIHMLSAFQAYSQPMFNNVQRTLVARFKALADTRSLWLNLVSRCWVALRVPGQIVPGVCFKLACAGAQHLACARAALLCTTSFAARCRSSYVLVVTIVSCAMPFFSSIVGLCGERCFLWARGAPPPDEARARPPPPTTTPPTHPHAPGALVYWPLGVLLPTLMFLRANPKVRRTARHALYALNALMCGVTLCAIIGSVQSIVVSASTFKIFE